ncbi:MAG TPA: redoxin domain-containing protein [Acidobacteriota bacterium]|nr:redoxin domain-containing protein [Acidobacteriota bacterium]
MRRAEFLAAAVVGAALAAGAGRAFDRLPAIRICARLDEAAPPGTGPVLLVFFSTGCSVCFDDLFEARYLVDKKGWPVTVIGISAGPREELREFLEKHAWTLPVVLDSRRTLSKRFEAGPVPFKILLFGQGTAYRDDPYLGLEERRKEMERCLTRLFLR